MITRIQVKNFRCLRYVDQPLGPFQVLIGPNACGKTTFLDVVSFVGTMLEAGLDRAIEERTSDFRDLVWQRGDGGFEFAIEADIPIPLRKKLAKPFVAFRYELRIDQDLETGQPGIFAEKAWLLPTTTKHSDIQRDLFPFDYLPPDTIITTAIRGAQRVLSKAPHGSDNFYIEARSPDKPNSKGWVPTFKLGTRKSALANLPEDEEKFPVATWFKNALQHRLQKIMLNSGKLRKPSPFFYKSGYSPDGANLPWVVYQLEQPKNAERYGWWIDHVRTALPEIERVWTCEKEEDRSRYLMVKYTNGLQVPAWMVSDGTLRLLALSILAYVPDFESVCLLEEPENGIHPRAVETVFGSLSQVYDAQVLLATHSPVVLSAAKLESVLCFRKTQAGATDIVSGLEHPMLRNWKGNVNLGELYAGGVL